MGETMARIVVDPIASSCKSFNETSLHSFEWDSNCSDCWKCHLVTHPSSSAGAHHPDSDEELSVEDKPT